MKTEELLELVEKEFGKGCAEICRERHEQLNHHNWSKEHDKINYTDNHELVYAAVSYALPEEKEGVIIKRRMFWPWIEGWWLPSPENRINELRKSGALLASEIDVKFD